MENVGTLTEKEIKNKELVKEHRELVDSFMKNELAWKAHTRKKILRVYDAKVDDSNIRFYMLRKVKVFLSALLTDKLDQIANYFPKGYSFAKEKNK